MMKTKLKYNMTDAVFKAKLFLESQYLEAEELKWFYCTPVDSYSDERNRVEFYVLEGEPPRGYIIASYEMCTVKAFDIHMRLRMTTCVSGLEF